MKIYLFRGEKSLSAEMKIVFTELLIYERNEKHEESLSQVIVCLREKKGLLSCNFSPPTPWKNQENQARSREPRQKLWTYIHLRIAFVPTHRRRRKDTASSCSNFLQCFTNSVSKSWPASTNHDLLEISKQDRLFPKDVLGKQQHRALIAMQ